MVVGKDETRSERINKNDFPLFFEELLSNDSFLISSSSSDEKYAKFIRHFLIPQKIDSIHVTAIYLNTQIIGAIFSEFNTSPVILDTLDLMLLNLGTNFVRRVITAEHLSELEAETQKKILETKLAKTQLDLAMESAQLAMWDYNVVTGIQQVNDQWFERLGYPQKNKGFSELTGWSDLIHPEDKDSVMAKVDLLLKGETSLYEARYRILQANGKYQWVLNRGKNTHFDSNGKPTRATGVNLDITPLVILEESLKDSVKQFKNMISSLPMPLAMLDTSFNLLTYTAQWKKDWGKFHNLKIGESFFDGSSIDFKQEWEARYKSALSGKTLEMNEEFITIPNGNGIWIRWTIKPWNISIDKVGGIIIYAEDITSKKESEIKIFQTSKLSSLGEMAGGIAHEINNPLSIIKGYIDTLQRKIDRQAIAPDQFKSYLNKMDQTVQRISRIVTGMKRFSRDSSTDNSIDYSLNQIINETLDICSERIKNSGIEFKVSHHVGNDIIRCRPIEISQVFLNLINNSIHAVATHDFPWIHIECLEEEDKLFIKVIDSGEMIPEKVKAKLFQPFFTTKDVGIGTGLGLSISRGIIESHRGKLFLDDKAANTTFVIEFNKSY